MTQKVDAGKDAIRCRVVIAAAIAATRAAGDGNGTTVADDFHAEKQSSSNAAATDHAACLGREFDRFHGFFVASVAAVARDRATLAVLVHVPAALGDAVAAAAPGHDAAFDGESDFPANISLLREALDQKNCKN